MLAALLDNDIHTDSDPADTLLAVIPGTTTGVQRRHLHAEASKSRGAGVDGAERPQRLVGFDRVPRAARLVHVRHLAPHRAARDVQGGVADVREVRIRFRSGPGRQTHPRPGFFIVGRRAGYWVSHRVLDWEKERTGGRQEGGVLTDNVGSETKDVQLFQRLVLGHLRAEILHTRHIHYVKRVLLSSH